ncbi:MAG: AAA family ATPase [Thermodesulfobacteriota bacterium]
MHVQAVTICQEKFPTPDYYPFNLNLFHKTRRIPFLSPVTFFVGENGTGKSTLLEAIGHQCGIYKWENIERTRFENNPYEKDLYKAIDIQWSNGWVPGSFFASEVFRNFAQLLDEWAASDPKLLNYFGGKSLITQSHGQSFMSYFRSRYRIRGIYIMDEPETALSPTSQMDLLEILDQMGRAGHAQFIIATHSPILMSCPDASIYSFDEAPVRLVNYKETSHFRIYKNFILNSVSS